MRYSAVVTLAAILVVTTTATKTSGKSPEESNGICKINNVRSWQSLHGKTYENYFDYHSIMRVTVKPYGP